MITNGDERLIGKRLRDCAANITTARRFPSPRLSGSLRRRNYRQNH
jgi:hypothetical protein